MTDQEKQAQVSEPVADVEPKPKKAKSKKKLYIWLGVVVLLVVAVVGVWNFASTNFFCGRICHSMGPTFAGWVEGEHKQIACIDCHAGEGFVEEFKAHLNGVKELYVMVTENPTADEVYASPNIVPAERCLTCHDEDWDALPADHPTKDSQCAVCHRDSIHPNEKPLFRPAGGE